MNASNEYIEFAKSQGVDPNAQTQVLQDWEEGMDLYFSIDHSIIIVRRKTGGKTVTVIDPTRYGNSKYIYARPHVLNAVSFGYEDSGNYCIAGWAGGVIRFVFELKDFEDARAFFLEIAEKLQD